MNKQILKNEIKNEILVNKKKKLFNLDDWKYSIVSSANEIV